MPRLVFLLLLLPSLLRAQAPAPPLPHVASGTVRRFPAFATKLVAPRTVDVWLPAGYPRAAPYDVVYMQDGQMLFDSTSTWNHQEWQVDETLGRLESEHAVRPSIVVAIWNTGLTRSAEYYPQKALALLDTATRTRVVRDALLGYPLADNYLRFIVQELKPFVDRTFATAPGRGHTFLMGSSMGGLLSWYGLCEYPKVFGGAACLSTHWPGTFGPERFVVAASFAQYLDQHLPLPATHKLYFDHGSATLDSQYGLHQETVDDLIRLHSYGPESWMTRYFPGADHSERAWARRLQVPLLFLLNGKAR